MAGALLRSGSLTEFYPLGAVGKPVYSAANQIRAAIRRRADEATANLFAIPKQNEQGDVIDWYAPQPGAVVPWSSATVEERAQAKALLQAAQAKLGELSASMLDEDRDARNTERQVFGKLLAQATAIPSDEHIYLVQGLPVITFWGFHPLDAPPSFNVIGGLDDGSAAQGLGRKSVEPPPIVPPVVPPVSVASTEPAPAITEGRRRRPWWWWLLLSPLLLLLLLALLYALRQCGIETPLSVVLPEPTATVESPKSPDLTGLTPALDPTGKAIVDRDGRPVWIDRDGRRVVYGADGSLAPAAIGGEAGVDSAPLKPDAATPTDAPGRTDAAPGPDDKSTPTSPDDQPTDAAKAPDSAKSEAPTPPKDAGSGDRPLDAGPKTDPARGAKGPDAGGTPPGAGSAPGAPLTIPERATRTGDTGFLDGRWRSDTGLQDAQGNPLQLGYDFKSGDGSVTMQRSVGDQRQSCAGPAKSAMQGGRLVITQGAITCPDGATFRAPRVVCKVGAGGRAECEGVNEDGSKFPVSIAR